jgi:hypothetical protein
MNFARSPRRAGLPRYGQPICRAPDVAALCNDSANAGHLVALHRPIRGATGKTRGRYLLEVPWRWSIAGAVRRSRVSEAAQNT